MKTLYVWFYLSCKRQLKRKVFLILLVLLPLITFIFGHMQKTSETAVSIGLFSEDRGIADEMIDELLHEEGFIRFYKADSKEDLYADVKGGEAECGYLFYEGMDQNIRNGDTKRQIGVIISPSTVLDKLSTEIVFSSFMKLYSKDVLENYALTDPLFSRFDRESAKIELGNLYDKYLENESTFHFEYQTVQEEKIDFEENHIGTFPIRGIAAVYIFLTGLFAAVNWFKDYGVGMFTPVPYSYKRWVYLITIGVPVLCSALSGIIAIYISGMAVSLWKEIVSMLLYAASVTLFCELLRRLFGNALKLCSIIPILTLGSLIFCPIIINIKEFVPLLGVLEKIFIPYYYLSVFLGGGILILFGVFAAEFLVFMFWKQEY